MHQDFDPLPVLTLRPITSPVSAQPLPFLVADCKVAVMVRQSSLTNSAFITPATTSRSGHFACFSLSNRLFDRPHLEPVAKCLPEPSLAWYCYYGHCWGCVLGSALLVACLADGTSWQHVPEKRSLNRLYISGAQPQWALVRRMNSVLCHG